MTTQIDTGLGLSFGTADDGRAWIGRVSPRRPCEDVVNHAQIKYFCSLVRDATPWYWDEAAATARYGGIVSPPGMLFVWSMPLPWQPDGAAPPPTLATRIPLPGDTLINVTTDSEFLAPVIVGDRLWFDEEVTEVSDQKRTALGAGHFMTTTGRYRNQRDELVATNRNVMFRYDSASAQPRPDQARAAAGPDDEPGGEQLPETTMAVTLRLCVHDAGATRDLFPGHHDPDYARAQNARNVYLNTMFLQGFADRIGGEWAGPDAWLARRRLDMVAPICVGDTMRTTGRVVERWDQDGHRFARVALAVTTDHGTGARAELVYRWP